MMIHTKRWFLEAQGLCGGDVPERRYDIAEIPLDKESTRALETLAWKWWTRRWHPLESLAELHNRIYRDYAPATDEDGIPCWVRRDE